MDQKEIIVMVEKCEAKAKEFVESYRCDSSKERKHLRVLEVRVDAHSGWIRGLADRIEALEGRPAWSSGSLLDANGRLIAERDQLKSENAELKRRLAFIAIKASAAFDEEDD